MTASAPRTIVFGIAVPIERVCALLERTGAGIAFCDVDGVGADVAMVEALARLQLAARRHDCQVRLRNASTELRDLVAFMGLRDVLPG